jgi:hypothetical protein
MIDGARPGRLRKRRRIGSFCTEQGCVGDEALFYGGRWHPNFTGQARRCRGPVSGHGRGSLQGRRLILLPGGASVMALGSRSPWGYLGKKQK